MRSLYQTHTILNRNQRTDPASLAHHLVRAASALPQVVNQATKLGLRRPGLGADDSRSTLMAAGRAAASLLVAIKRLGHVATGAEVEGQVIYAYVQMFKKLLQGVEEASATTIEEGSIERLKMATKAASPEKTKAKTKSKEPKQANSFKDQPTVNAITILLCGIVDALDPETPSHKALFEGFAHSTFTKLGGRLYITVFGHARGVSIEEEIAMCAQAGDTHADSAALGDPAEALEVRQAKLEAPYLIHLLQRIMHAAPSHLGSVISSKTGRPKQANNQGSMKGALAEHAKGRLQNTLVNCMFGTEAMSEDHPFRECLKMPASLGPLPVPKVKEAEVREWFQEEVWRLLGWEILSKEVEA